MLLLIHFYPLIALYRLYSNPYHYLINLLYITITLYRYYSPYTLYKSILYIYYDNHSRELRLRKSYTWIIKIWLGEKQALRKWKIDYKDFLGMFAPENLDIRVKFPREKLYLSPEYLFFSAFFSNFLWPVILCHVITSNPVIEDTR